MYLFFWGFGAGMIVAVIIMSLLQINRRKKIEAAFAAAKKLGGNLKKDYREVADVLKKGD